MFHSVTGNLLHSNAEALVNTVNCVGHMGKGLAYQFKLAFPENNLSYLDACQEGSLRIGTIHVVEEQGKLICNFPTKDHWRGKSKIEYIHQGLDALLDVIARHNISSIAIPPLGAGLGGLLWQDVKPIILEKLQPIADTVDIFLYEPSLSAPTRPTTAPQPSKEPILALNALLLIKVKEQLQILTDTRMQSAIFLLNFYRDKPLLQFKSSKTGPRSSTLSSNAKKIKEFQEFYGLHETKETFDLAYQKQVSKKTDRFLQEMLPLLETTCALVNNLPEERSLSAVVMTLFFLQENPSDNSLQGEELLALLRAWQAPSQEAYTQEELDQCLQHLEEENLIAQSMFGIQLL